MDYIITNKWTVVKYVVIEGWIALNIKGDMMVPSTYVGWTLSLKLLRVVKPTFDSCCSSHGPLTCS
jgi:hypothetical protein